MKPGFTLGRNDRLKSRKIIDRLFASGKKISLPGLQCRYLLDTGEGEALLQVGVAVSKKHFPRAVDRNRVKRLVKECWRMQKDKVYAGLPPGVALYVFFIFTAAVKPEFADLFQQVKDITARLEKQLPG